LCPTIEHNKKVARALKWCHATSASRLNFVLRCLFFPARARVWCEQLLADTAPPTDHERLPGAAADAADAGSPSDAALTCSALTACWHAAASSFLGRHYLASHQRAALHAVARGVFLDAKVTLPSLPGLPSALLRGAPVWPAALFLL
jgi:hypothetical protein